jgi:hypothetical protein
MELKKKDLLENKNQLNESLLSFENVLMAAGFIPVVGEIADIALIIYYIYKKEYLFAALMLIALVPTVGDILIKPFIKGLKAAKTETAIAVKLAENPQMAAKVAELAKSPAVEKTIEGLSKVNMSWGQKLREGLSSLTRFPVVGGAKAGIDAIKTGGKFSTGLKNFFRNEKLVAYVTKHGMEPQSFISKWWLNVSARTARRNSFRKFIMANNLLAKFGIPSLTTFEEKIANDAEFRKKLADDPQFGQYVGQDMTPEEFNSMRGGEEESPSRGGDPISALYGLGMLKTLAKMYV